MRAYGAALMSTVVFVFSCAFVSPSLAAEDISATVKKVERSVVVILTYDEKGQVIGQGSGFFINERGDVITNRHVLVGADSVKVKTSENRLYPVKMILAEDTVGDLVRVSVNIPLDEVRPIKVSASFVEADQRVFVVGTPNGHERKVSEGVVSAVRYIPSFGNIIQLTAPVAKGSSGSPVLNMKGELIGVITFKIVVGQSLNFAMPAGRVKNLKTGDEKTLSQLQEEEFNNEHASAEELVNTGILFGSLGDFRKALLYFKEAVRKNHSYALAYFLIGYTNAELGLYNRAVEAYKRGIRFWPDVAEWYYHLSQAHIGLGQNDEAIKALKQAVRLMPDYAEAHFGLGYIYLAQGKKDSALKEYEILKDLDKGLADELLDVINE